MKLLTINKYIDIIVALSISFVIFIPGIKFFFFSSLVNIICLIILIFSILVTYKCYGIKIGKRQNIYSWVIFLIFCCLLFSGFFPDGSVTFNDVFRYVSVWLILNCVVLLVPTLNKGYFYKIVVLWSLFLGLCYQGGIIKPSGDGELSYLILDMQLGMGFSICFSKCIFLQKRTSFYFVISMFILYCVLTLSGRAALVGCAAVSLCVLLSLLFYYWKRRPLLILGLMSIIFCSILISINYIMENVLNDYLIYKLTESNTSSNSRLLYYAKSIQLIIENPLGLGLQKYNSVLGFYPHNIFLEMGLNAGLVPMLILIFPFIVFFMRMIRICTNIRRLNHLPLGNLTLFLTFCWMFSNDLGSAYVLFTAMIIFFYHTPSKEKVYLVHRY